MCKVCLPFSGFQYIHSCVAITSISFQNSLSPPKETAPISSHSPLPRIASPWEPLTYILGLWICLIWTRKKNGIRQYVAFYVWPLSFYIMFSSLIGLVTRISTSFFWLSYMPIYRYTAFCLSSPQLMDIYVDFFGYDEMMLLWTFVCLCEHVFSVSQNCWVYSNSMLNLLSKSSWIKLLSKAVVPFYPINNACEFQFHHGLTNTVIVWWQPS